MAQVYYIEQQHRPIWTAQELSGVRLYACTESIRASRYELDVFAWSVCKTFQK